ncbi:MAG TPA: glycosyltransferase family 2 protein [Kiritimatiellia bacterium]|nr:glycosyltransferase family 2 protein [Kiritimatiellia bacterium]HRT05053.1 glycosyltransferase family 2 protein [Kiritimatiellia bacterium]
MSPRLDFCIILPVYYNEESLRPAYEKLKTVLLELAPRWRGGLLYVDDGSGDGSFGVLENIHALGEVPTTVVKLSRNFGQVMAIRAGLAHCEATAAIVMSADGQEPVELIPQMLAKHFDEKHEVVVCTRADREEGAYRTWTSRLFYATMRKLCIPDMPTGGFDCFLLGPAAQAAFRQEQELQPFLQGQILRLGFPRAWIPYVRLKREFGRSRWTLGKKVAYFFDGLMNYSFLPIRAVSFLGMLLAALGLLYAFVVLLAKLFVGNPVKGWTPLMIVVLVLGGAQMLTLGVFGEYLWRILVQVQRRSPYFVEQVLPPRAER